MIRIILFLLLYLADIEVARSENLGFTDQVMAQITKQVNRYDLDIKWQVEPDESDQPRQIACQKKGADCYGISVRTQKGRIYKGMFELCVDIPVAASHIQKGDKIDHVEIARVPKRLIGPQTIIHADEILHMEARTSLKEGQVFQKYHIMKPTIVKKGDTVCVRYETPVLTISNYGVAQKDGAMGGLIPILCAQKMIQARVVGAHQTILNQVAS